MNFSNEMLEKANTAKTAEELVTMAKENGIEITADEAAKYFAELHKTGELSDDELNNVVGGCETSNIVYGRRVGWSRKEDVVYEFNIGESVAASRGFSIYYGTITARVYAYDCGYSVIVMPAYDILLSDGTLLKNVRQDYVGRRK